MESPAKIDRTSWIIVILCALGIGYLIISQNNQVQEQIAERNQAAEDQSQDTPAATDPNYTDPDADPTNPTATDANPDQALENSDQLNPAEAELNIAEDIRLQTEKVSYYFSPRGGAIARAEMRTDLNEIPSEEEHDVQNVIINRFGTNAIGALSNRVGEFEQGSYQLTQDSPTRVTARGELNNGLQVRKIWTLVDNPDGNGHLVRLTLQLEAPEGTNISSDNYSLSLGSIAALQADEQPNSTALAYQSGSDFESEHTGWFKGSKILWMFERRPPQDTYSQAFEEWYFTALKNQYYTTILSPVEDLGKDSGSVWAQRFKTPVGDSDDRPIYAITAATSIGELNLSAGDQYQREFEYYIGPKNYTVLNDLEGQRDNILDYNSFPVIGVIIAPISKLLNVTMNLLAGWFSAISWNWALAIILLTIGIRTLMWPLHARAQRTMKKMSKLKPKMDELREKYADDPQKMQQENMKLMGQYGVNPMGGCLPMLLQMPIFLGFYRMLFYAAELRHEHFLWVQDLSQPDTVAYIMGIPLNPLPIVMGLFSLVQLKLTPATGDPTQRRMMYLMPIVMLVICYTFASALALYWTVSNIFTIGQTLLMKRMPEPELKKKNKKSFAERVQEAQAQRTAMQKKQQQGPKPKKNRPPRTGG